MSERILRVNSEIQKAKEKSSYYLSFFEDTGNYKYSNLSEMYSERVKKLEELENQYGQTQKVLEYQDDLTKTLVELQNKLTTVCNFLEDDGDWVEAIKKLKDINKKISINLERR